MKICYLFLSKGLLLLLVLTGCSIQMPVTEGLVFSSSDPYGQKHEEILPFIRYGGAVTVVSSMPMYSALQDAAVDEHGDSQSKYLNRYFMTVAGSPGLGLSFVNGRRFAVAFTPGLILTGMHADATVRTFDKVFLTVNHQFSIRSGTELILQRPVWEKNGGGISVGSFYRNQPMQFVKNDEQWSRGEPSFNVQWYGVRLMGQTPAIKGDGAHIRGYINAGYVNEYKVPLVGLGMAVTLN